jgi:predicted nucleic acid-binding protein
MAGAVCGDTSFLFSLYGRDVHAARALAESVRLGRPVTLTTLIEYELLNAVRLAGFRHKLPPSAVTAMIAAFGADVESGRLVIERSDLGHIIAEAKRLSALHTLAGGYRAFDILHVAAAVHFKADIFLTFDANQRTLAEAAGLKVRQ